MNPKHTKLMSRAKSGKIMSVFTIIMDAMKTLDTDDAKTVVCLCHLFWNPTPDQEERKIS